MSDREKYVCFMCKRRILGSPKHLRKSLLNMMKLNSKGLTTDHKFCWKCYNSIEQAYQLFLAKEKLKATHKKNPETVSAYTTTSISSMDSVDRVVNRVNQGTTTSRSGSVKNDNRRDVQPELSRSLHITADDRNSQNIYSSPPTTSGLQAATTVTIHDDPPTYTLNKDVMDQYIDGIHGG